MSLTDLAIRQTQVRDRAFKLHDHGGLYLLVNPNGRKYWRFDYRFGGKRKTLAIGVYPDTSLNNARKKLNTIKAQLEAGDDPSQLRRKQKLQATLSAQETFSNIAREWHNSMIPVWTPNHSKRVIESLEIDIFPHIGNQPISKITPPEVLAVIRRIEARDALETASKILQRCAAVFRYAVQTGRALSNPASELSGALKKRKAVNMPAMPKKELPEFLRKVANYDGHAITRFALQLIVLTFVRPGELRGAQWSEFDFSVKEWHIPAERMKMREAHIVPLSDQAITILEQLKPITGRGKFVFPNQSNGSRTISENTMTFALYRLGYKGVATAHGFRAVASTILNESGFDADAIERQLAHRENNKVRAAYHRSEYLEERKRMMHWWANYLDGLTTGNVAVTGIFERRTQGMNK